MLYTRLNNNWNADPNTPEANISINDGTLTLNFYLNYFLNNKFKEGDKGQLTFNNCYKYYFGAPNDEGYYRGQHRYKLTDLPFGEFYLLKTDWRNDFPANAKVLNPDFNPNGMKHFIFFLKENTFECVAEDYTMKFITS